MPFSPVTTSTALTLFSQSSRIRAARPTAFGCAPQGTQYSMRTWRRAATGSVCQSGSVERLVDEAVGELVVLAAHGRVGDATDLARQAGGVEEEVLQRAVLDLVLPAHLLHHELRVGDDLELVHAGLDRAFEPGDERRVLRDVVRRDADRLSASVENGSVLGLEHECVRGRSRIPARPAVGEEPRFHWSRSG